MPDEKLLEFLKNGRDWERRPTNIPGVFVLKLPSDGKRPSQLVVEVNPLDEYGKPTKKRGLIVRNSEELKEFINILNDSKLPILMAKIDEVNPRKAASKKSREGGEVIEV